MVVLNLNEEGDAMPILDVVLRLEEQLAAEMKASERLRQELKELRLVKCEVIITRDQALDELDRALSGKSLESEYKQPDWRLDPDPYGYHHIPLSSRLRAMGLEVE